jgi:hypothetical protein
MGKYVAPIVASLALLLAAPAMAGGLCGGAKSHSVEADGPVSTPVDTASTVQPDSSG